MKCFLSIWIVFFFPLFIPMNYIYIFSFYIFFFTDLPMYIFLNQAISFWDVSLGYLYPQLPTISAGSE